MLGNAGRRLVEGVVGLFALLGFLYVPLGRHTGYEHARAVLSTPAAGEAIADLGRAATQLRQTALDFVTKRAPPSPGDDRRDHETSTGGRDPRPVPPKLK